MKNMKTWWDTLLEKQPNIAIYPASLAKQTVLKAEQGDENSIEQIKLWGLWDKIFS